ncbi:MAG: hypothetical protein ACK4UT_03595 [Moraxellaceae bacterium]
MKPLPLKLLLPLLKPLLRLLTLLRPKLRLLTLPLRLLTLPLRLPTLLLRLPSNQSALLTDAKRGCLGIPFFIDPISHALTLTSSVPSRA